MKKTKERNKVVLSEEDFIRLFTAKEHGYELYTKIEDAIKSIGKDWSKYRHTFIGEILLINPKDKVR